MNITDVYHTIGYYLAHQDEIDAYIIEQNAETEQIRQEWEAQHPFTLTRETLMARLKAKNDEVCD